MADQFPMLSLTPDVPDPVAPSAAPAQSIQQQPAAAASTTAEPLAVPTAATAHTIQVHFGKRTALRGEKSTNGEGKPVSLPLRRLRAV